MDTPREVHDAADEATGPVEADGLAEVLEGLLHAVARS
jgi:hydroxymethylpyrimidine pyrophosphatase-like HAD family hydrolase